MKFKNPTLVMDTFQAMLGMDTNTFGSAKDLKNNKKFKDTAVAVRAKLSDYMKAPAEKAKYLRVKAQAGAADMPKMFTDNFDTFLETSDYDMTWMEAFKEVPVEASHLFFEIATIKTGLQWRKVGEGGKVRIEKFTGEKLNVELEKYGGALGWSDELVRGRKLARMLEIAEQFRDEKFADMADRHMALLAATTQTPFAYQGTGSVANDIKQMGAAGNFLLEGVRSNFRGINANTELLLYLPPSMRDRIDEATRKLVNDVSGSSRKLTWNIRPTYTFNENLPTPWTGESAVGLLVLPGRKIQRAELDEIKFQDTDPYSLTYAEIEWKYYGAGVGFDKQIIPVPFKTLA